MSKWMKILFRETYEPNTHYRSILSDYNFDQKMLALVEERKRHKEKIKNSMKFEEALDKLIVYLIERLELNADIILIDRDYCELTREEFRIFCEKCIPILRDKGMDANLVNNGTSQNYIRVTSDEVKKYLEKLVSKVETKNDTVVTGAYR